MNTELLKSKLLEAAFNGSLTHADTSTWKQEKLGKYVDVLYGFPFQSSMFNTKKEGRPIIRIRDVKPSRTNTYSMETCDEKYHILNGDMLVGMDGNFNVNIWNGGDAYLNQRVCKITAKEEFLLQKYLYYYLPVYLKDLEYWIKSVTVKHLGDKHLQNAPIPLPPVEEQQRIVAALEEGFAYIDAVASAKQNLSDSAELLRSKILQAAFDGSLTGVDAGIWDQKKLRDISTKIVDGDHNPPKGQKEPTPYIMLSSQNINEDKFVAMNKVRYLSKADFDLCNKRTKLTKGDVLLTTVGTVGRSCVNTGDEVYCFQRSVTIITPAINSFFLKYYFDSPDFQQMLLLSASGNAQKGFYLNKLKEVEIPVPPLAEQQRIVAKIEELFAEIDKLTK